MIEVGAETLVVPIKGTATQIRTAILRFAIQRGIATENRTPAEIGTDVLGAVVKYIRDNSIDRQRVELLQAQQAANDAAILADNDL